jgi:hypothetical protein
MSLKLHFLPSNLDFFPLKTLESCPMNMKKGSIKIFPNLTRGRVQNGVQIRWLATAGVITETPTGEYKTPKKKKWVFYELFLVRTETS